MLLWTNRRTDLGRTIAAADGLAETLQQSAVRVRNETTGSFVTQTMDCSVGQIEGLICSKPFGESLLAFWAVWCSKACEVWWLNQSMGDVKR